MSNQHPLIGLVGPAQAGKDTVAKHLVAHHGYVQAAFADSLRDFVRATDPGWALAEHCLGYEQAKRTTAGFRDTLIRVGNAAREHISPDVWVRALAQRIAIPRGAHPIVISDVRYQNEADMVRELGGSLVAIYRPDVAPESDAMRSMMDNAEAMIPNIGGLAELSAIVEQVALMLRPLDTL